MNLHLVDINPLVVDAWKSTFAEFSEIEIRHADVLAHARGCVVSPANSYGFMDGGVDAAYRAFFGASIESVVRDAVTRRPEGHLPVGASLVVPTRHPRVPYMIVAPTMTMPEAIESRNVYRAMRAVLRIAGREKFIGSDVYCPGLGSGVGGVAPTEAAAMMATAYGDWKRGGTNVA
jgi:O-acetyl-ADP-ribose deacetylase (regulator of RNase III)